MYNEQIEELINAALVDGILTEKEKSILLKKAQSQGIDVDEFEMVLDARLYENQQTQKKADSTAKSNSSSNVNVITKCPNCGCVLASFSTTCPDCGYQLEGVNTCSAAKELEQRIEAVYDEAEKQKAELRVLRSKLAKDIMERQTEIRQQYQQNEQAAADRNKEKPVRNGLGGFMGSLIDTISESRRSNKAQDQLNRDLSNAENPLKGIDTQIVDIDKNINDRIAIVVRDFPIPTNKADLFEFLTTMRERGFGGKYIEALNKAELLFAHDPLFEKHILQHKEELKVAEDKLKEAEANAEKLKIEYEKLKKRQDNIIFAPSAEKVESASARYRSSMKQVTKAQAEYNKVKTGEEQPTTELKERKAKKEGVTVFDKFENIVERIDKLSTFGEE